MRRFWIRSGIIFCGRTLFLARNLSLGLSWASLVLMRLALAPFIETRKSSLGVMKYILFQETFSVALCIIWGASFFLLGVWFFVLLKLGVAPLGGWLESLLEELRPFLFFVLTLPKFVPVWLICRAPIKFMGATACLCISGFIVRKIFGSRDIKTIIIYLGNFSVLFAVILGQLRWGACFLWFCAYTLTSFVILFLSELKNLGFLEFFWVSALPPSPFFFLKVLLILALRGGVLQTYLIILFVASIPVLFFIWFNRSSATTCPSRPRTHKVLGFFSVVYFLWLVIF